MTQHERILGYLERNESITPIEAFGDLGITKLATRISELRKAGVNIGDSYIDGYNRFGDPVRFKKYWLVKEKET